MSIALKAFISNGEIMYHAYNTGFRRLFNPVFRPCFKKDKKGYSGRAASFSLHGLAGTGLTKGRAAFIVGGIAQPIRALTVDPAQSRRKNME
jgi:hypothetical protein